MNPTAFGGDVYPALILLAALSGFVVALFSARRIGLPPRRVAVLLLLLSVAMVAGARLFRLWEMGALGDLRNLSFSLNGLRYPGGLIAFFVALPLLARCSGLSAADLGDALAPALGVALTIARIGCLLEGCCFGSPSDVPWAITFPLRSKAWVAQVAAGMIPRSHLVSLPVHPLQIYFGLLALIVTAFAFRAQKRRRKPGDVLLLFLILHEGGKAILESLRVPYRPALQITSALVCVLAATLWWARRRRASPARILAEAARTTKTVRA